MDRCGTISGQGKGEPMKKTVVAVMIWVVFGGLPVSAGSGVRVGILGDRTGGPDTGVFCSVVSEMALLRPDFVVNVGDLIEGPQPDAEAIQREWDAVFEALQPLKCPIYYAPGNNDIFDDTSRALYIERTGVQPDYAFTAEGIRFIVLDNSRMKTWDELTDERMEWLKKELAGTPKEGRLCMIFHKPFWVDNFLQETEDRLHPLFAAHGVDYVFSGHYHQYLSMEKDGVHYVMIGSSGGHIGDNPYRGEYYHFAWMTMDEDGFHLAVLPAESVRSETWRTMDDSVRQDAVEERLLTMSRPVLTAGDKAAVRLDFAPGCGVPAGAFRWNCNGTSWIVSPSSGTFDLNSGPDVFHCAALLRGSHYPVPKLEITMQLEDREYCMYRTLQPVRKVTVPFRPNLPESGQTTHSGEGQDWLILEEFGDQDGGTCPTDPVSVALRHDGNRLYLSVRAERLSEEAVRIEEVPPRDRPVFMSDCMYLMFWSEESPSRITQVVVNIHGGLLDQQGFDPGTPERRPEMDPEWNADATWKVERDETGWQAEISVPLMDLGIRFPGAFRFNALRYQPEMDGLSSWITPATFDRENAGILDLESGMSGPEALAE